MKNLNLAENQIEDGGAKGLAQNKSWFNLEELDLRYNKISDEGAQILSSKTEWKSLRKIYLKHNKLSTVAVFMKTLNEKYSKQLIDEENSDSTQFEVEDHQQERVQTLQEAFFKEFEGYKDERREEFQTISTQRKTLKLSKYDIQREGFLNTAESQELKFLWMPYIRILDLSHAKIEALSLVINRSATDLEELILAKSQVDGLDLIYIGGSYWPNLQTLDLSLNHINYEGVESLCENQTWTNLQTLDLRNNKIGEKGAEYLSSNKTWTNLQTLNLSHNNIGDKGAEYLCCNKTWTHLKILGIYT